MSDLEFIKTPFYDMHVALGAQMGPFGGYMMPIRYKGIIQEHNACRKAAALFDTCHMGEFMVKGSNATADLENLVTCDVSSIKPGQCRYGLLCNEKGGVIDDLLVYRFGDSEYMVVVNAGTQGNDFGWIKSHVSAGTVVENISERTAKFDLQGPGSAKIMQKIADESIVDLKYYYFMPNKCGGKKVIISRTGYTGEIGFEIYGEPELALKLWARCTELGAEPAGLGARDTLRLEMGMPLYGHELSEQRNAAESGFAKSISQTKKFIGSEIVQDVSRKKHALVGITLDGRRAARNGDIILDEAGAAVGEITSGSFAPSLEIAIAIGYVNASYSSQGRRISIRNARQDITGVITGMPFYKEATARRPLKSYL